MASQTPDLGRLLSEDELNKRFRKPAESIEMGQIDPEAGRTIRADIPVEAGTSPGEIDLTRTRGGFQDSLTLMPGDIGPTDPDVFRPQSMSITESQPLDIIGDPSISEEERSTKLVSGAAEAQKAQESPQAMAQLQARADQGDESSLLGLALLQIIPTVAGGVLGGSQGGAAGAGAGLTGVRSVLKGEAEQRAAQRKAELERQKQLGQRESRLEEIAARGKEQRLTGRQGIEAQRLRQEERIEAEGARQTERLTQQKELAERRLKQQRDLRLKELDAKQKESLRKVKKEGRKELRDANKSFNASRRVKLADDLAFSLSALNSADIRTPAGQQTVVTLFNKILDPGSVVRESEFARTTDFIDFVNRYKSVIRRQLEGGVATEEVINELKRQANKIAESFNDVLNTDINKQIGGLEKDGIEVDRDNFFINPLQIAINRRQQQEADRPVTIEARQGVSAEQALSEMSTEEIERLLNQ